MGNITPNPGPIICGLAHGRKHNPNPDPVHPWTHLWKCTETVGVKLIHSHGLFVHQSCSKAVYNRGDKCAHT